MLSRLISHEINEEQLRFSFSEYAQLIIDLAMGENDYKSLTETQFSRVANFRKTQAFRIQMLV